jgi:hypothetical protein
LSYPLTTFSALDLSTSHLERAAIHEKSIVKGFARLVEPRHNSSVQRHRRSRSTRGTATSLGAAVSMKKSCATTEIRRHYP